MKTLLRVLGIVVLLSVNGCSMACTLIGCANGLMVNFATPPATAYRIEVTSGSSSAVHVFECPNNQCGGARFEDYFPQHARIKVITATGTTITEVTPEYQESYPNGRRCGPACRQASVTVTPPA